MKEEIQRQRQSLFAVVINLFKSLEVGRYLVIIR